VLGQEKRAGTVHTERLDGRVRSLRFFVSNRHGDDKRPFRQCAGFINDLDRQQKVVSGLICGRRDGHEKSWLAVESLLWSHFSLPSPPKSTMPKRAEIDRKATETAKKPAVNPLKMTQKCANFEIARKRLATRSLAGALQKIDPLPTTHKHLSFFRHQLAMVRQSLRPTLRGQIRRVTRIIMPTRQVQGTVSPNVLA
jgi:hypothetical protein